MTTNVVCTDGARPGDRTLAIWVGQGYYHFTTYTIGNANVFFNVNYGTALDGAWNYIYFGYERRAASEGHAQGYIVLPGGRILETEYGG